MNIFRCTAIQKLIGALEHFIFRYIGNNNPNWLSCFSEGWLNHQPEKSWWRLVPCIIHRRIDWQPEIPIQWTWPHQEPMVDWCWFPLVIRYTPWFYIFMIAIFALQCVWSLLPIDRNHRFFQYLIIKTIRHVIWIRISHSCTTPACHS